MARIYKRENVWYLDIRVKGHRFRRKVGTSKKVAELALKDAEVRVAREEFGFIKNDIGIEKLIERFLEYNRTNHRASTAKRYKAVTDHLLKYLKAKQPSIIMLSQLTAEVIEGFKTFRRDSYVNPNGKAIEGEQGKTEHTRLGARGRTVNLELDGIKTMLNLAIRWGYLHDNPMKQVKPLKTDDKKQLEFLSKEECQRFLDATPAESYPIYFTFLNTGMRKAELENLQWKDVDLKLKQILIRPKKDWKPKTGQREIPIGAPLLKVLSDLRKKNQDVEGEDYVFPVKGNGRSHNWLRTELIRIAREAGIPKLTKVHTLRHTFASHLMMAGVDLPSIQKLMGHSDIETTMIYAHLASDHLANAIEKLSYS